MGGFPTWTLIGMGISALSAVIFTALAFFAQSPNLLARFRLLGSDFTSNARRLTGLGLASTLLGLGFFMAGVPIGTQSIEVVQPIDPPPTIASAAGSNDNSIAQIETNEGAIENIQPTEEAETGGFGSAAEPSTSEENGAEPAETTVSGSFGRPAEESDSADEAEEEEATTTPTATPIAQAATLSPTRTPSPTATPSPIPTATPTPTITPTAIKVDTISVSFDGSVTWVYRVPGNNRLQLINNGDQLLLESGRAMVKGVTWQEVRLLDGRLGWIQLRFLELGEE